MVGGGRGFIMRPTFLDKSQVYAITLHSREGRTFKTASSSMSSEDRDHVDGLNAHACFGVFLIASAQEKAVLSRSVLVSATNAG